MNSYERIKDAIYDNVFYIINHFIILLCMSLINITSNIVFVIIHFRCKC